jgi:hypothetical protein
MFRQMIIKSHEKGLFLGRLIKVSLLICLLASFTRTGSVSASSNLIMDTGKLQQPASLNDASLTSPASPGQVLTIIHGYNDPAPGAPCKPGTPPDHCNNQKYGLDLKPSKLDDKQILAPLPGKINWMDDVTKVAFACLGILTKDNLNLTICHFGSFNVNKGDEVQRGKLLGLRNTDWIHLSLDARYDDKHNQIPQPWKPIAFIGIHTIEGQSFEPLADSVVNQHNTETIGSNVPGTPGTNPANSSTALVFDASGSMSMNDPSGKMKLQAAKSAGGNILDIISAENQAGSQSGNQVAVVSFSANASLDKPLTADMSAARNALDALLPQSRTAMPAGLQTGIRALTDGSGSGKSILILLSDGMPNVDLSGGGSEATARQQTLDQATEAGQKNICVYTVGFGDPAGSGDAYLDEDFLRQVAANSGCGSYYNAQNAIQLANVYVQLRHSSTGTIVFNHTGTIAQGQQLNIGTATMPTNQALALFTLNWPGSRLDAQLTDPSGRVVDSSYPGASISTAASIVSIILQKPQAGLWKFAVNGVDVPEGVTDYDAILSVRPNPANAIPPSSPSSAGIPIILLVLAGGGIGAYALTRIRKRAPQTAQTGMRRAYLVGQRGLLSGRSIPLTDGLLIGRGSTCHVHLEDASASRQHARFRYAQGAWYIQDMKSAYGTYVNGRRVMAQRLKSGDRIQIGSCELEFRNL